MKKPLCIALTLLWSLSPLRALPEEPLLLRETRHYDRAEFVTAPEVVKEELARAAELPLGREPIRLSGWVEFDFEVPEAGWYELWFNGAPPEWARNLEVDGESVSRMGISFAPDDSLPEAKRDQPATKELNLYLEKGKHTLRYSRWNSPAWLPSLWALYPAQGPEGCLRLTQAKPRIAAPGETVTLSILGGGGQGATEYELLLQNEQTDELTEVGRVAFPAGGSPQTREVPVRLEHEGLYRLLARVDGTLLRPSDLKGGLLLAAPAREPARERDFALAGMFVNGVILQREKPLPIWGHAPAGAGVRVSLAGRNEEATADENGQWQVTFAPLEAGGPHELVAECNGQEVVCKDVQVGEVWILGGQSNTGGSAHGAIGGEERVKDAVFPLVRQSRIFDRRSASGRREISTGWQEIDFVEKRKHSEQWYAIPFVFGTELYRALDVPVGIICIGRGGTMITTWTGRKTHEENPSLRPILEVAQADEAQGVPELQHLLDLQGAIRKWRRESASAAEPKPAPALTREIRAPNRPALLHEALVEPLAPFPVRGFLWYQGESDGGMAAEYAVRFPAMVADWRSLWNDPALPFLYAQVSYGSGKPHEGDPGDHRAAEIKWVQGEAGRNIPHSAMIATYDLMRPEDDVHYRDKLPVGHRFALAALANVYGEKIPWSGPVYRSLKKEPGAIRLSFDHAGGGLEAPGGRLGGFEIAGEDRRWHTAEAQIDGETVLVQSPEVPEPVAVRYASEETPSGGNLFNRAGLPCPIFRTDDWPLATEGVKWIRKH